MSSEVPTTLPPTTEGLSTVAPTTEVPTTVVPSTLPEPTFPPVPTTEVPTTLAPTTVLTLVPTTGGPTSFVPTTPFPLTAGERISCGVVYEHSMDRLEVRAWAEDESGDLRDQALTLSGCFLTLVDEVGKRLTVHGIADPLGVQYVRFVIPQVRLWAHHLYLMEITLDVNGEVIGPVTKGVSIS